MNSPEDTIIIGRNAQLFAERRDLVGTWQQQHRVLELAPDQLLHPDRPGAYIVRRGKLRVSEFLTDGREITRAVLQAGAALKTAESAETPPRPATDMYNLDHIVLMALGEVELWSLPPGALDEIFGT